MKNFGIGDTKIKLSDGSAHVTDHSQTLDGMHIHTSFDVSGLGKIGGLHTTIKDREFGNGKIIMTPSGDIQLDF